MNFNSCIYVLHDNYSFLGDLFGNSVNLLNCSRVSV